MTHLQKQGLMFSVVALVIAAAGSLLPNANDPATLLMLAALITALGVPHGALDTLFARELHGVRSITGWCIFTLAYLAPAALVVVLWHYAPAVFLVGFLLVSGVHFSGDPAPGARYFTRIMYGGALILLPLLLHAAEVSALFAFLVGSDIAAPIVYWLGYLSWPWLVGTVIAVVSCLRADWLTALELASVALLALLAPPLLAFTIFFCGMHSARHILRTARHVGTATNYQLVRAAAAPLLGALATGAALLWYLPASPIDARVTQLVFVGLAALTIPHMALVERIRLAGWKNQD